MRGEGGAGVARRFTPRKALPDVVADIRSYVHGAPLEYRGASAANPLAYPVALDVLLEADAGLFGPLDADGVPLQACAGRAMSYVPSRIAGYGLANWNLALRGGAGRHEAMDRFLRTAAWFERQPDGRFLHDLELEGMRPGWSSCLAQGEGISVLVRGWRATGDRRYLTQARLAVRPLEQPIDDGGLLSSLPDGRPFVEEYPGGRRRHVLNGALFAITGLDDLARHSGEPEPAAVRLRDALLRTLEQDLTRWSVAGWSIYSLDRGPLRLPNACTVHYHLVHVVLLEHLEPLAPGLVPLLEKWRVALGSRRLRLTALAMKSAYRVASGW